MLNNSAQGREFWIAIPPNEVPDHPPNVLEIYVTSVKRTQVTLSNPYTGLKFIKTVEPMQTTVFSTANGYMGWDWEVRESEQVTGKGLHLEAEQPISVYVFNAKSYSSDGYMAIPVTALGKEYYHLCYWDFKEYRDWGSGFVIVAIADNTKITIKLNGRGKGKATTVKKRDIGDVIHVTLQEGQTYMVRGDATTRGVFDLSGSSIQANKPVGFISFHMRTMIPVFDISGGRDHLCEMLPPVHSWGKKFATVELKRDKGQGDFFRILASEDDTQFECKYYDKENGTLLGEWKGKLKKAGDWEDYLEVFTTTPNRMKSIRGTAVWTADKPVLLMQYSYSEQWDGAKTFDPFMIVIASTEQYTNRTIFQTPGNKEFVTNWFHFIAEHNPNDDSFDDLKSLKIDGVPITQIEPHFIYNRIPGTNLYWARIAVQPGAHHVYGDGKVKFSGYIYGFSQWDSYGWPAAMTFNKLDEIDTLPPLMTINKTRYKCTVTATELRNGAPDDKPRQVDQGITHIELLDGSSNYNLKIIYPNPFKTYPPVYEAEFELAVIDTFKNAVGIFSVTDAFGNYAIDSVKFYADTTKRIVDTLAPVLNRTGEKGNYTVEATEYRNGDINENPKQEDSGIKEISLDTKKSFNFDFKITRPDPFNPPVFFAEFTLKVIDKYKDGAAFYQAEDEAGNIASDSIIYKGEDPNNVDDESGTSEYLLNIEPNPVTSNNLKINYMLRTSTQVKLELYRNNGELISVLTEGKQDTGLHTITLSTASLPSGVYYIRLSKGHLMLTKSFVITK
jgi:hypothetical protein